MRGGRICRRLLLMLVALLTVMAAGPIAQNADPTGAAADARKVWERAITAKGGRERLRGIRSFVVTSELKPSGFTRPEVVPREYLEFLVVLPNRLWQFHDYRPGLMGAGGMMWDGERGQTWGSNGRPAPQMYEDCLYRFNQLQFLYLMETTRVSPT